MGAAKICGKWGGVQANPRGLPDGFTVTGFELLIQY
jgi:hypothetical protein